MKFFNINILKNTTIYNREYERYDRFAFVNGFFANHVVVN